jgi:predicted ATPase
MFISHLELKNWKNFRSVDVILRPRVFLIGPNASGKSNLLDALRFLRDVAVSGLASAVGGKRGGVSSLRCLSARRHSDLSFSLVLSDDDAIPRWRYKLAVNQDSSKTPIVKEEKVERLPGRTTVLSRPDENDDRDALRRTQTALEQIIANQDFREVAEFFKSIDYRHIVPQAVRDPADFSGRQVQNDPFGRDFVMHVWRTERATRKAWLDRIVHVLKVAVPQLTELDVAVDDPGTPPHMVVRYEHWRQYPAKQSEAQLSDGTLRLLGLLWAMFEGEGPLLLEEPELSLHAELVRHLPELFSQIQGEIRRMRRKKGAGRRQIVLSTHSRDLLSSETIHGGEVLRLEPGPDGTCVIETDSIEEALMREGLTAADVLLPKAAPANTDQLLLPFEEDGSDSPSVG